MSKIDFGIIAPPQREVKNFSKHFDCLGATMTLTVRRMGATDCITAIDYAKEVQEQFHEHPVVWGGRAITAGLSLARVIGALIMAQEGDDSTVYDQEALLLAMQFDDVLEWLTEIYEWTTSLEDDGPKNLANLTKSTTSEPPLFGSQSTES